MLGFGLGLKAKLFGLGFEAQVLGLGLATHGLFLGHGFATEALALTLVLLCMASALAVPSDLVNITGHQHGFVPVENHVNMQMSDVAKTCEIIHGGTKIDPI